MEAPMLSAAIVDTQPSADGTYTLYCIETSRVSTRDDGTHYETHINVKRRRFREFTALHAN
eukprot:2730441-Prymnesium_polylepis.1